MTQIHNAAKPARRRLGPLLVMLAALIAVGGTAIAPAHAEDRRDDRRHDDRRDRGDWRWHRDHPYAYAPPPVVYAPPVVAAPSLNFVFPLHIH